MTVWDSCDSTDHMRISLWATLTCALLAAGCAGGTKAPPAAAAHPTNSAISGSSSSTNSTLIVTPENALIGKVAMVNGTGRFVVLSFPLGRMAVLDQRLNVYRSGLKVGELRVTGPQREDHIVADLVAGEAEAGDQVRSQ